ncbi:MAG: hypothetical protein EOO59_04715, partial [Hymenobacter sp.]
MATRFLALLWLLALLAPTLLRAQPLAPVPPWSMASLHPMPDARSYPWPRATAMDEAGNVFVAGMFHDTITLGSYTLRSAGQGDFYLAKYVPATRTWAWAVRGGGLSGDDARGLALHHGCVYITGSLHNNYANDYRVTLDSPLPVPQPGAVNAKPSLDLFVAKYFDHGTRASLAWCQVAGGADLDYGTSVAVSGCNVYVTGILSNDRHHRQGAVFGSTGPLPGLYPQLGTLSRPGSDLILAKYTDHGLSTTFGWSEVAGGTYSAVGHGVAVQGSSVYVVGDLQSLHTCPAYVQMGGHGRVPGTARLLVPGQRPIQSWLLAKYTDLGDHAAAGWSQVAGSDWGGVATAVAVRGRSVYVLGAMNNDRTHAMRIHVEGRRPLAISCPARRYEGPLETAAVLAKYTDHGPAGSFEWLQLDGTNDYYEGSSLVARGPWVYTLGYSFFNRTHTRQGIAGGTRRPPGARYRADAPYDVKDRPYLAGYYDYGPRAARRWVRIFDYPYQMGGRHYGLGLCGPRLYVMGTTWLPARFGRFTLGRPAQGLGFVVAGRPN